MKKIATFTLLFVSIYFYGQQAKIDSLKSLLLQISQKDKKLEILDKLNFVLNKEVHPDSSTVYFEEMVTLSKQLDSIRYETRAYRYLSEAYMKKGNEEKAMHYINKAVAVNGEIDDAEDYIKNINQLGRIYHHFFRNNEAIHTYKKGIEIYNRRPVGNLISTLYCNMGISYNRISEKEIALQNFLKGLSLAEKNNNISEKNFALRNIGWSYMDMQQYETANKYFLTALNDSLQLENRNDIYKIHRCLGINYSRWGKYDRALFHSELAAGYYEKIGNTALEFDMLRNISTLYGRMKLIDKSLDYANRAIEVALHTKDKRKIAISKLYKVISLIQLERYNEADKLIKKIAKDTINKKIFHTYNKIDLYGFLYEIKKEKHQYTLALKYLERYKYLNDSILKSQRDSKIAEMDKKYQTEKKENENLQLKADNAEQTLILEKETKQKWYFGIGLLVTLLTLGVFGFYYYRNKKHKEVIENLQRELHHRIKNNLTIIDTFIEVTKEEFDDKKITDRLNDLQNRIESINEVHQQLYKNQDITKLGIKKYVLTIASNIQQSFDYKHIDIQQHISDNLHIQADKSFPLGLIINEFLTNSFKYAFPNKEKGSVSIKLIEKDNHYHLDLADTGIGLPPNFDTEHNDSFGLRIISLLGKQLKGTCTIDGTRGVQLHLEFPK